jgi:hypothetical protein
MSAPAPSLAPPPRLLHRPASPAQREAARRNGAKSRGPQTAAGKAHSSGNARRHGLYARLHVLNREETKAFRAELRELFEKLNPRSPAEVVLATEFALASFQSRRAFDLDLEILARNPRDFDTVVRMLAAIGTFESRHTRRIYRTIPCIQILEQRAAEKKDRAKEPRN